MIVNLRLVRGHAEESHLSIDGIDMTNHVLADGLNIHAEPGNPQVTLTLRPDVLNINVEGPAGELIQRIRTAADTTSTGAPA